MQQHTTGRYHLIYGLVGAVRPFDVPYECKKGFENLPIFSLFKFNKQKIRQKK
jgi:hypothetical protein